MEVPVMTAVIYARYSTDSQREESIEGQIRAHRKAVQRLRRQKTNET